MKYRLAKDTLFVKAGASVIFYESEKSPEFVILKSGDKSTVELNLYGKHRLVARLIKVGWIEEVKPREWWVHKGHVDSMCSVRPINTDFFIKVREVIE